MSRSAVIRSNALPLKIFVHSVIIIFSYNSLLDSVIRLNKLNSPVHGCSFNETLRLCKLWLNSFEICDQIAPNTTITYRFFPILFIYCFFYDSNDLGKEGNLVKNEYWLC